MLLYYTREYPPKISVTSAAASAPLGVRIYYFKRRIRRFKRHRYGGPVGFRFDRRKKADFYRILFLKATLIEIFVRRQGSPHQKNTNMAALSFGPGGFSILETARMVLSIFKKGS